jgi:hypothetical protein
MTIIKRLCALILLALSISACIFGERITISNPKDIMADETCIDSFSNYAFSTPDIDGPVQEEYLPGMPWHIVSEIPAEVQGLEHRIAAVRSMEGEIEIWTQLYDPSEIYSANDSRDGFWVYKVIEDSWQRVPSEIEGGNIFVDQLFVTDDGGIWGRNVWARDRNLNGSPLLSLYNDTSNKFVPVSGTADIPNGLIDSRPGHTQWPEWDVILLDPSNTFWIFVAQDRIYHYDPSNSIVTRYSSLAEISRIAQVTSSPDGSMYFRAQTDDLILRDGQIFHFSPKTDEIKPILLPQQRWPSTGSILVDHTNKLWLGVFGWQDSDGNWETLHPQMEKFLRLNRDNALWRYYQPPSILMESSDGRLWFGIPRSEEWRTLRSGLAWYDPNRNIGCWFTTEGINVVEAPDTTLWLIANRKLYRYSIDQ